MQQSIAECLLPVTSFDLIWFHQAGVKDTHKKRLALKW